MKNQFEFIFVATVINCQQMSKGLNRKLNVSLKTYIWQEFHQYARTKNSIYLFLQQLPTAVKSCPKLSKAVNYF